MGLGQKDKQKAESVTMRAYRFYGTPTEEQQKLLRQFTGSCRFLWNRMLADIQASHQAGEKYRCPTPASYKKIPGLEWLREVDSLALANVQLRLDAAFKRFFKSQAQDGPRTGYPNFKKKHKSADSYTTNVVNPNSPNIWLKGNILKLPKIPDPIKLRLHRQVKPGGILKSVTITHEPSDKWYFSLLYEYPKQEAETSSQPVEELRHIGLDMSLPHLYVDSNGEVADFAKPYRKLEAKIGREQRKLSHMVRGSSNYKKQCLHIAKLHAKAKHQRNDMLHKLSYRLTEQYDLISIEDLDMAAMKKSLHFGKSISDNGWGDFVRMLSYKSDWKGKTLVKVSKWFPSSKKCTKCGYIHRELHLNNREYLCPQCGNLMDRDKQAAINIDLEGFRIFCGA